MCLENRMNKALLIITVSFLLTGCLDTALDATDNYVYNSLNYLDQPYDDLGLSNDPFDIIAVSPNGDEWDVIVEYSGGCNEHSFYTWWDDTWQASGQTRFFLAHYDNDDPCEAIIRDTLNLDLNYIVNTDLKDSTIIRIVNASNGSNISVDPLLAAISQGYNCGIAGEIEENSCGQGIWENQWILLNDSVRQLPVWLIPVRSDSQISLDIPEEDDVEVGFTFLFGYESAQLSNSCFLTDEGYAIPVYLNCIETE